MPDAIDDWLARDARVLPLDAEAAAVGAALGEAAAGADVVFVGELNHFIHEKSDFRLLVARALIACGIDAFAEELGWSDGTRLQRYFATRDARILDRLSLFGFKGEARTDRDDAPRGVFAASAKAYPHALMRAEQERFYRAIAPRAFFGIDIDAAPHGYLADIAALDPALADAAARAPGESMEDEAARLDALAKRPEAAPARVHLEAARDSLRYCGLVNRAESYEATRPAMAARETAMKARFAAARAQAGGKFALFAHALHLAKDDALIEDAAGVGPGGGRVCSLGHHIAQELGLRAYAIWLIYGAGEDSQPLPDLPRTARFAPDTLNRRLAQRLAHPTLIRTTHAPDGAHTIAHMYNATFRTALQGQVDALYFLPRVSPMRAI